MVRRHLLTPSPCSKPSSSRAGRRVRHVRTDTRRPLLLHRKFALTKKLCRRRVSDHTSKGRFCGARHSVALTREGRAFGWGWDGRGQLLGDAGEDTGRGATGGGGSAVASPVELRPGRCFREVACGWWHTLLVVDPTSPYRGAAGECAPAPPLDLEK